MCHRNDLLISNPYFIGDETVFLIDERSMAFVTTKVETQIQKSYKACDFLCPLPFCWRNAGPAIAHTKRRLIQWLLSVLISFVLMTFCLARLIEAYTSNEWTLNSRLYLQMLLLMFNVPLALHLIAFASRYDIVRATSRSLNFFKNGKSIRALELFQWRAIS